MKWIVDTPFTAILADGTPQTVRVQVAMPRRSGRTAWGCRVGITGVLKPRPIYGEDALQALCLALDFVGNMLYLHRRRGLRLKFPEGQSVPLYAYFRLRDSARRRRRSQRRRTEGR